MKRFAVGPLGNMGTFMCPACKYGHSVGIGAHPGAWSWNGDTENPTLQPSILLKTGSAVDPNFVDEVGDPPLICHSFVTDGKIQFLNDCTHDLAGKTVELPEVAK